MAQPWTDDDLEAYAVRYVARFDCTEQRLRNILSRKMSARFDGAPVHSDGAGKSIDRLIDRFKELGYINDKRFAQRLVESLRSKGASTRKIRERLRTRGVDADLAAELLIDAGTTDDELSAAVTWVRRRRMGIHRPTEQQKLKYQRDLAALARAGFSFEVARRALTVKDEEGE